MGGRLKDELARVTGAGSIGPGRGNGKATSVLLAREDARVFAADLDPGAAEATRRLIREEGATGRSCQVDAVDSASVSARIVAERKAP